MLRRPTYLRVMVTENCTMSCKFCHAEGLKLTAESLSVEASSEEGNGSLSPIGQGTAGMMGLRKVGEKLSVAQWKSVLQTALEAGVRKVKFLGGEPLVMKALPELIRFVKASAPDSDVSLITSGAAPVERLEACFEAGLDRANLSIHGFSMESFSRNLKRGTEQKLYEMRRQNIEQLLSRGRFLKLNYVYTGPEVEEDLNQLLTWAAPRKVVVSVLDDLNREDFGPATIGEVLCRLRGPALRTESSVDPHSLPTELWAWPDGLRAEVKSTRLGEVAPWGLCNRCPRRPACREGIFALRLDPDGTLRGCTDRPDVTFNLLNESEEKLAPHSSTWDRALNYLDVGPTGKIVPVSEVDSTPWTSEMQAKKRYAFHV